MSTDSRTFGSSEIQRIVEKKEKVLWHEKAEVLNFREDPGHSSLGTHVSRLASVQKFRNPEDCGKKGVLE
jgi:hypothetical protein